MFDLFSDTFLTITDFAEAEYKAKGSKFLAYAFPVQSEGGYKPASGRN